MRVRERFTFSGIFVLLLILLFILFCTSHSAYKTHLKINQTIEESRKVNINFIEELEVKQKHVEGEVVAFVQDFTNEPAEMLYKEKDSNFYVLKVDKVLYKVQYDMKDEVIEYMLLKDEVVYEM